MNNNLRPPIPQQELFDFARMKETLESLLDGRQPQTDTEETTDLLMMRVNSLTLQLEEKNMMIHELRANLRNKDDQLETLLEQHEAAERTQARTILELQTKIAEMEQKTVSANLHPSKQQIQRQPSKPLKIETGGVEIEVRGSRVVVSPKATKPSARAKSTAGSVTGRNATTGKQRK
jgi:hypothetical protein